MFLLGTPALEEYLSENGFKIIKEYYPEPEKRPDFVVLAYDTTLTYEKLRIACDYISGGRSVPDAGSFMECIQSATGKRPSFIAGKPNPCMIRVIMEKYGYSPEQIAVIGDRLNTDILSAINAGVKSICVLKYAAGTAAYVCVFKYKGRLPHFKKLIAGASTAKSCHFFTTMLYLHRSGNINDKRSPCGRCWSWYK